jgi:hypothetical protein
MPYDRAMALLALERRLPPGHLEAESAKEIFASLQAPVPELFRPGRAQGLS